jgi:hypothetical protein
MGGGGSPGTPTTYAPPAPPTAANAAAVQASADARQKALEKQGITSTLLQGQASGVAGSPGGNLLGAAAPGKNTLLGGG